MTELLTIYDDNLIPIGTKPRDAVHAEGCWHRTFHCWAIYRDARRHDRIIVQRRAASKNVYPNKLDITAAGHYTAGETTAGGLREIKEELGIEVAFDDLIPLGRRIDVWHTGGVIDREFCDVFLLIYPPGIGAMRFDPGEVAALAAFDIDAGLAMMAGRRDSVQADLATWQDGRIECDPGALAITPGDFVPRHDPYLHKILLLAQRALAGEREHLLI